MEPPSYNVAIAEDFDEQDEIKELRQKVVNLEEEIVALKQIHHIEKYKFRMLNGSIQCDVPICQFKEWLIPRIKTYTQEGFRKYDYIENIKDAQEYETIWYNLGRMINECAVFAGFIMLFDYLKHANMIITNIYGYTSAHKCNLYYLTSGNHFHGSLHPGNIELYIEFKKSANIMHSYEYGEINIDKIKKNKVKRFCIDTNYNRGLNIYYT
jgi:hypothetical protein